MVAVCVVCVRAECASELCSSSSRWWPLGWPLVFLLVVVVCQPQPSLALRRGERRKKRQSQRGGELLDLRGRKDQDDDVSRLKIKHGLRFKHFDVMKIRISEATIDTCTVPTATVKREQKQERPPACR